MISGLLSFQPDEKSLLLFRQACRISSFGTNSFLKLVQKGFEGGYFLCPGLPYSESDFIFTDEANDIMVLLSGSIHNREDLYRQLGIRIPVPDPELISRLFLRYGPEFVADMNGDFSICIHQQDAKHSYIYRDHLGIRPLAIASEGHVLMFSSDTVGLSRAISGGKSVYSDYLQKYFKYTDLRKGPSNAVKKLLPGHYLHFSVNGVKIHKYWNPEKIKETRNLKREDMLDELMTLVNDAVRIRCDNRFSAGAHVTGGLDSGIVSFMAFNEYSTQNTFYGYSWSPENYLPEKIKYDEREIINKSYNGSGISIVYTSIQRDEFAGYVKDYYYNQGYFSEDKCGNVAMQHGTNLIFTGWGGDEFISTADRGIDADLLFRFKFRTFFKRNPLIKSKRFISNFLFYIVYPVTGILDRNTARSFRDEARYLKRRHKRSDPGSIRTFYFHKSRRQLHLRLLKHYHLQDRCENWFINGYRKGVEYRYPLLDKRIIEYMIALPSGLLCGTNSFRPLLRDIGAKFLPPEIISNLDKSDPVYWSYINSLFAEYSASLTEEISQWKANHNLGFIDFEMLNSDIEKFKRIPETVDCSILSRGLVYIKAIHEFTLKYRLDD